MKLFLYGNEAQRAIVECEATEIFLAAGRRWGKNFGIRNRHLKKVTGKSGFQYLHAAPTYSQVQAEWEKIISQRNLRRIIKKASKKDPYPRIEWINGSQSHFRSLERADNLRNGEYDEACIDESQDADEDDITMVIEPMLASRFGTIILAGQFRGHDWRYERYYLPGQDPDNEDVQSWRFPSSSGVVFQSKKGRARLKRIKENTPKLVWYQEWECIPSANQSGVFSVEDINRSTVPATGGDGPYVIGLDLGMIEDPAAVCVFDVGLMCFVYAKAFEIGQDHEITAREVSKLAERYGNPQVIMDSTGGATGGHHNPDEFTKEYEKYIPTVRPYYWNQSNKNRMVNKFSLALEKRKMSFNSELEQLLKQLKTYEYTKKHNGNYDFHGPKGKNDDMVAAALMAYEGFSRGWYDSGGGSMRNIIGSIGG